MSHQSAFGKTLKVRIVLAIKADALANDPIVTTLGHTSTAPAGKDNVARGINGEDTDNDRDIYTVDVATTGALVKIAGVAANGTREASAQQQIAVKAQKQAFATIDLTHDTAVQKTATTDEVKYNLSVTVPNLAPAGSGKTATDLAPTPIKLATTPGATTGTDVNRVILSYPLPAGATLDTIAPPTAAPKLADNSNGVWTPVYLTSSGIWSTVKPVTGTITEVGFILEAATSTGTPTVDGPSLPMNGGTPYTGFSVKVLTTALGTYASTAMDPTGRLFRPDVIAPKAFRFMLNENDDDIALLELKNNSSKDRIYPKTLIVVQAQYTLAGTTTTMWQDTLGDSDTTDIYAPPTATNNGVNDIIGTNVTQIKKGFINLNGHHLDMVVSCPTEPSMSFLPSAATVYTVSLLATTK